MPDLPDLQSIIDQLRLQPHPEGGYYREMYRAEMTVTHPEVGLEDNATRAAGTAIYFLIPQNQFSAFHRVRTDETWHLYLGGPIELHTIDPEGRYQMHLLTHDLAHGQPQITIPAHHWQAARCAPDTPYALGGCTVAPGFDFADFEMPDTDTLLATHPDHEPIIRALSRPK